MAGLAHCHNIHFFSKFKHESSPLKSQLNRRIQGLSSFILNGPLYSNSHSHSSSTCQDPIIFSIRGRRGSGRRWQKNMDGDSNVRKVVMLVADPTRESVGALQYALSHAVVDTDTLILFHVDNPSAWKNRLGAFFKKQPNANGIMNANSNNTGGPPPPASSTLAEIFASGGGGGGAGSAPDVDFLDAMKQVCTAVLPKLNVVVEKMEMAEGQDKASIILAQSWVLNIDLIIIGQRRKLSNAILGSKKGVDTAEYLILNSKCGCVAVQKKGQNAGYILTSKTQKNFWLLA